MSSLAEVTEPRDPEAARRASIPALEVMDLRAGYGRVEVLHGVNLTVPRGSVVALMGPNGAGKTTLLNVAAGLVPATSGCVHVAGMHVNGVAPDVFARAGVCSIPEGRGVFPNLTVRENLRVFSHSSTFSMSDIEERSYAAFPRLHERRGQMAGTLSGGERQMLALCRAFTSDPAVLLLDEISMGLAPIIVSELYDKVGQLASEGIAILLVEQFATAALKVADYAAIMRQGRIEVLGEPTDVAGALSEAYLGAMA
ncbi:MAG TPA: ABC transporter ATP-binding protein [Acidimicrobiales bacterium]|nr:ABC transporter ATP-binding protein [Acidimicrobiales bacterium]